MENNLTMKKVLNSMENHFNKVVNTFQGKYMGGIPEISKTRDLEFYITDGLYLKLGFLNTLKIDLDKIINVRTMNEDEIRRDVTLTRLFLFGVFAFAMKKKKVDKHRFIVISYIDFDIQHELIIEVKNPQAVQSSLLTAKKKRFEQLENK